MSIEAVSPEQALKMQTEAFAKLKKGSLFSIANNRFFIAVEKHEDRVEAIELTDENRLQILFGGKLLSSTLPFNELRCLHTYNYEDILRHARMMQEVRNRRGQS